MAAQFPDELCKKGLTVLYCTVRRESAVLNCKKGQEWRVRSLFTASLWASKWNSESTGLVCLVNQGPVCLINQGIGIALISLG